MSGSSSYFDSFRELVIACSVKLCAVVEKGEVCSVFLADFILKAAVSIGMVLLCRKPCWKSPRLLRCFKLDFYNV